MPKQKGPVYYTGTIDGICYYKMNGRYYARRKSSLSRKRVKRDVAFALTRVYAGLLGQASQIASDVYKLAPKDKKKLALYRAMTGEAMILLKQGVSEARVRERLELLLQKKMKTAAEQGPMVRMRNAMGDTNVVRMVCAKKLTMGSRQAAIGVGPGTPVWTVMTRERTYEVRVENARCVSP